MSRSMRRRWLHFPTLLIAALLFLAWAPSIARADDAVAPTVSVADPREGPEGGGTTVTLTGTGFTGATGVSFGAYAAADFTVDSDTQITAITAPGTGQYLNITVTGPGGDGWLTENWIYDPPAAPAPTISSVTPDSGPATGLTGITITGSGFTGANGVTFGGFASADWVVDSDTQIRANSPGGPVGAVPLVVTTPHGDTDGSASFTYLPVTPSVDAISPASGVQAGGTSVVLTGSRLDGATAVTFGAVPASSFVVDSPSQITAVSPSGLRGAVDVVVTTAQGASPLSSADRFTYQQVAADIPLIQSASPTHGGTPGGTLVSLQVTSLDGLTGVVLDGVSLPYTTTVTPAVRQPTFDVQFLTPAHALGTARIHLVTTYGTSNVFPFGYQTVPAPAALFATPTRGAQTGGTSVTLHGRNLDGVSDVTLNGIPAAFVYHPATSLQLAAYLTVTTPPASPGAGVLRVRNTAGETTTAFTVVRNPAPFIDSVAPVVHEFGGEIVTVTGHAFARTTGVTVAGSPVAFTLTPATTPTGSDRITFAAPAHAPGSAEVVVTTPAGPSRSDGANQLTRLRYQKASKPSITLMVPGAVGYTQNHVAAAGGPVTIVGDSLDAATGVTVGGVAVPFEQRGAALLVQVPSHATGTVPVVVVTPGGASAPATLTVVPSHRPVLTALGGVSFSEAGGRAVTVSGSYVDQATAVTVDGVAVAFQVRPPVTQGNQPTNGVWTIRFAAPAHAPGRSQIVVTTPAGTAATAMTYAAVPAPTVSATGPATVSHWGGRVVRLSGTFLNGATSVTVDGVPVAFQQVGEIPLNPQVSGDIDLTFTAPLHSVGSVPVVVTTPAGTSAPVTLTFQ